MLLWDSYHGGPLGHVFVSGLKSDKKPKVICPKMFSDMNVGN